MKNAQDGISVLYKFYHIKNQKLNFPEVDSLSLSLRTLLFQGRVVCTVYKDSSDGYNKLSNWAFATAILFGSSQTQHCLQVYDCTFQRSVPFTVVVTMPQLSSEGTNKGLSVFPCHRAGIDVIPRQQSFVSAFTANYQCRLFGGFCS